MANVKKCDRCGEIYSIKHVDDYWRFSLFDADATPDPTCTGIYHGIRVGEMADLCERCRDDLAEWYFHPAKSKKGKSDG